MAQVNLLEARSIKVHEDVVFEPVGDETVLLHLETGTYYGLNPIGRRMWELLVQSGDPKAVLTCIAEEYDVPDDVLRKDFDALLNELFRKNLIIVSEAAGDEF